MKFLYNVMPTLNLMDKRKVHSLSPFQDMTCFGIMHTDEGREMWGLDSMESRTQKRCSVQTSHRLYLQIRREYVHGEGKLRRKRRAGGRGASDEYDDDTGCL